MQNPRISDANPTLTSIRPLPDNRALTGFEPAAAAADEPEASGPLCFIDLCCGCGGWTEGLVQAGLTPLLGVDRWNLAVQSWHDNFSRLGGKAIVADVRSLTPEMLPDADIIVGSPPCQKSSTANKTASGGTEDYSMLRHMLSLIEAKKPRWWALENVPPYWKDMPDDLRARIPRCVTLAASDYGLNHWRKRAIFGDFPDPFPGLGAADRRFRTPRATEWKKATYDFIKAHKKFSTPTASEHSCYRTEGHRGLPCFWEYLEALGLDVTPERMLWAMGFPPGYRLAGGRIDGIVQAGNAVCPPVARAVGWGIIQAAAQAEAAR